MTRNGTGCILVRLQFRGTGDSPGAHYRVEHGSSISAIVHDQVLATAGVSGDFFGDDSSKSIEFNELLPASGVAVPPQAFMLIESNC